MWFTEFRCGRTITETIPSPGRPNEITTPEMINKIHDIGLNDPKVKVRELAEVVSISTQRVVNILHTHFVHEKGLCKMGAAIAHNRPKTHFSIHFGAKFGLFITRIRRSFCVDLLRWVKHESINIL